MKFQVFQYVNCILLFFSYFFLIKNKWQLQNNQNPKREVPIPFYFDCEHPKKVLVSHKTKNTLQDQ